MEKIRKYIQDKLDIAYSKQQAYLKQLDFREKQLEEKSKIKYENVNEKYQNIFPIETDIEYLKFHIDECQKDLDKYSEFYFEVNPITLPKKVKINGTSGKHPTRKK